MPDVIPSLLEALRYQQDGRREQAEAMYLHVLRAQPDESHALYLYGLLLLQDDRPESAMRLLRHAAALRADGDVHLQLARACLASGEAADAIEAARAAIAASGPASESLYVLGTALNAARRPAEAIAPLQEAVARAPGHAAAHLNLGNAYTDLDRLDMAEAQIRHALSLDPHLIEAHVSLGFVLVSRGALTEAIACYHQALALDPECGEAHWNLATALLLAGQWPQGWVEYEWRKKHREFRRYFRQLRTPEWTGGDLAGQTLLVCAEQGLGDTIQLARYAPLLAARGARVVLGCDPALIPLLRTQPGFAAVVPRTAPPPPHDLWVDQMSLPRLFDTQPGTVPAAAGYLAADPTLRAAWAARLAHSHPKLRIGFVWAGNPLHSNDRRRSLPAEAASRLVRPDFVNLQVGPRAKELGLPDLSPHLTDYAQTAALAAGLDLVLTVDTSVAHLAGALGVPVWVMLPAAPDWRWLLGRDDTPWYHTMRLFRQTTPGDWDGVVGQVLAALPA